MGVLCFVYSFGKSEERICILFRYAGYFLALCFVTFVARLEFALKITLEDNRECRILRLVKLFLVIVHDVGLYV